MIGVDTNILVYAHRRAAPEHVKAREAIRSLTDDGLSWAIPVACIDEFLSVVTNQRLFPHPSSIDEATDQIDAWLDAPGLTVLADSRRVWPVLRHTLRVAAVGGVRVHDARIAALCVSHGVRELWTADRDYGRFPGLRTRNPLVGES